MGKVPDRTLPFATVERAGFVVASTGQILCYDDAGRPIAPPKPGEAHSGQDAQYGAKPPAYRENGDATITDLTTGLMWTQNPGDKKKYAEAVEGASACRAGGHTDWRLPTVKELYSLILFSGTDPDPKSEDASRFTPFIDATVFKFRYGDVAEGDRIIDAQYATSTLYRGKTMRGNTTMFGVNFADGRIKGYPIDAAGPRGEKKYFVLYVRGKPGYGANLFEDNGDGTVTDGATGLMWMKVDSGHLKGGAKRDGRLNRKEALAWAESLEYAGHADWRLPDAKELLSIVDYTRCPDVTDSAAIDPVFETTAIVNEGGKKDYPYFWTSTSHCGLRGAQAAVYVAFGRGLGWMPDRRTSERQLLDVHGAGCQRSDPKTGDAGEFPQGRGPQGDVVRIGNHVRCVRDIARENESKR
ncbi:MAG: hypothetical protein A2Z34_08830 [Planctomycetes bacterium RBG_16_59_8]|nr:MAG: hypothetical protein A2Z34_08830 [Planctomycetes bacterium RBG_16_59_8]